MRKEDNREKYKEYDHQYYIKHRRPNSKIGKLETKISDLQSQLAEKNKIIWDENKEAVLCGDYYCVNNAVRKILEENRQLKQTQNQKAIEQLEKVNGVLTDTILEVAANEFDTNRLCYLEEKFYEKIDQQINELKGEKVNEIKSY